MSRVALQGGEVDMVDMAGIPQGAVRGRIHPAVRPSVETARMPRPCRGNGFIARGAPAHMEDEEAGPNVPPPAGDSDDRDAVIASLFDPDVSVLLAELEAGPLALSELAAKSGVSPGAVESRLSRLVGLGYVARRDDPAAGSGGAVYEADATKLAAVMERDENYESAVDGLAKLDGFLN